MGELVAPGRTRERGIDRIQARLEILVHVLRPTADGVSSTPDSPKSPFSGRRYRSPSLPSILIANDGSVVHRELDARSQLAGEA